MYEAPKIQFKKCKQHVKERGRASFQGPQCKWLLRMLLETVILVAEGNWKWKLRGIVCFKWEFAYNIYEENQLLSKARGYVKVGCGQYSFQGSRTFDTTEEDIYSRKPGGVDVGLSKNDPKPSGKLGEVIRDNPQQRETHPKVFLKSKAKICYCFYLFICPTVNNSMLISESGVCHSEVGLMGEFCQHHTKGMWELLILCLLHKLSHMLLEYVCVYI